MYLNTYHKCFKATDESFIEDINSLLNSADLPNIFQYDEKQTILEEMQSTAKKLVSFFRIYFIY